MAEYQKDKEDVQEFLNRAKDIISEGKNVELNNFLWHGRVNKTLTYMSETGVKKKDIEKVNTITENYIYLYG